MTELAEIFRRHGTQYREKFIRRFLQHVLPKGFIKVRYYGLFSPGNRHRLHLVRQLLNVSSFTTNADIDQTNAASRADVLRCPKCGREMEMIQTLRSKRYQPP